MHQPVTVPHTLGTYMIHVYYDKLRLVCYGKVK